MRQSGVGIALTVDVRRLRNLDPGSIGMKFEATESSDLEGTEGPYLVQFLRLNHANSQPKILTKNSL
jgi:hypothetical protein